MRDLAAFVACCTVGATGCAIVVFDEDGGGGEPPGPDPTCLPAPDLRMDVRGVTSATLVSSSEGVGDVRLHFEGLVDGVHTYGILDLAGDGLAELASVHEELLGGATWVRSYPSGYYARIRQGRLEVLETWANTATPSASVGPDGPRVGSEAIAVVEGAAVFTCPAGGGGWQDVIHRHDVSDPVHLGEGVATEAVCDLYDEGKAIAREGLWVNFGPADVRFLDLASGEGNSHGWVTDGVHAYGEITAVATDGEVVAVTLENDAYVFLYYARDPVHWVVYSSFGPGEKKLLGVVDGRAIVAVPRDGGFAVVAHEIAEPPEFETPAPRDAGTEIVLEGATGDLQDLVLLTSDESRLVVADGERLFVLPHRGVASVGPLVVVKAGATDEAREPCAPEG